MSQAAQEELTEDINKFRQLEADIQNAKNKAGQYQAQLHENELVLKVGAHFRPCLFYFLQRFSAAPFSPPVSVLPSQACVAHLLLLIYLPAANSH